MDIEKKIKKLASLLGEASWRIKDALGFPGPDYTSLTINELKIIFRDSSSNSEEEFYCYKELFRRIDIEIVSGIFTRVRDAYFLAIEVDLEEMKLKALQKWDELSLKEVEEATKYEDLKIACDRAPKSGLARNLANEKKEKIVEKLFNEAQSLEDYAAILKKASLNSPTRPLIVKKIYDLSND